MHGSLTFVGWGDKVVLDMGSSRADRTVDVRWWSRPAPVLVMLAAAVGWVTVVVVSHSMGTMSGTMGLSLVAFCAVWLVMMTAMMLPGVAPFASFYSRTFTTRRERRLFVFACGYLFVWALTGVPAFGLAWLADRMVTHHATVATALAVSAFVVCGVYQLTGLKDRCLAQCRSPLGFTLKYSTYQGAGRDLRAGMVHGGFCLGCCWALMLVLFAFGLMNVLAIIAVASVVLVEKSHRWGVPIAKTVGVAAIVFAMVVAINPAFATGLHQVPSNMTNGTM